VPLPEGEARLKKQNVDHNMGGGWAWGWGKTVIQQKNCMVPTEGFLTGEKGFGQSRGDLESDRNTLKAIHLQLHSYAKNVRTTRTIVKGCGKRDNWIIDRGSLGIREKRWGGSYSSGERRGGIPTTGSEALGKVQNYETLGFVLNKGTWKTGLWRGGEIDQEKGDGKV